MSKNHMRGINFKVILYLFFISTSLCYGQVETFHIAPILVDTNYSSSEDSSTVSRNTDFQVDKLFLFIGGTKSSSSLAYNALRLQSAKLGFDFINLSYLNDVAAASLANSTDSLAFNNYRQELCFGTPLSNEVDVDSFNSIYARALKLIQYLDSNYPDDNWGQYLIAQNSLDWSKIIVGGHSQGAGHACYLAKKFSVDRVLMFSGPNDYSNNFSNSANWLRAEGITPIDRHFAYLSLNDEVVDFSKQFDNLSGLGMLINDDTTFVDNSSPPYNNSHFLYTTQPPGIVIINHSSPVKLSSINNDVWEYMLTEPLTSSLKNYQSDVDLVIFPNPTFTELHLKSTKILNGKKYTLRNIRGQKIDEGKIEGASQYSIDVSGLRRGTYFLTIDNISTKVIKL